MNELNTELFYEYVKGAPCDYAEARFEETQRTRVVFMGRELEECGKSESSGGAVRVYEKGSWGFASFTSVDDIKGALTRAVAQARLAGKKKGKLFPVKPIKKHVPLRVRKNPLKISLKEKASLLSSYNAILMSGKNVQSTQAMYRELYTKKYFANTDKVKLSQESVDVALRLAALARDGVNVQMAPFDAGGTDGFQRVEGLEGEAEKLLKKVEELLRAEPVKAGKYMVIIDPEVTGLFAHEAFGHLSEADFLYENKDMQKLMKKGARFGPDFLNITDDGTLPGCQGTHAFDDEGVPMTKTLLVKNGIFNDHLHSRETAEKMKERPTGNARAIGYRFPPIVRMTNTFVERGATPFEDMVSRIPDGLYVKGDRGGQTNCEMFTFTAQEACEIKNGKLGKLLRDVVLTGNVFETLKNIQAVGNDFEIFGGPGGCGKYGQSPLPVGLGGPHVMIKDVIIGGK